MPLTPYTFPIFLVFPPHPSLSLFKTNNAPDTLHISHLPGLPTPPLSFPVQNQQHPDTLHISPLPSLPAPPTPPLSFPVQNQQHPNTLNISPLPGHCCRQCHPQRSRSGQLLWHRGWSSHGLPPPPSPPFHPPPSPLLPGGCSKRTVTSQC